jgi:hypothetical protein
MKKKKATKAKKNKKKKPSLVASYLTKKYGLKTKYLGDGLTEIVI